MKADGTTSTAGAGGGANLLLEQLAAQGGGRYYAAANPPASPTSSSRRPSRFPASRSSRRLFPIRPHRRSCAAWSWLAAAPRLQRDDDCRPPRASSSPPATIRCSPSGTAAGSPVAWTSDLTGRWAKDWVGQRLQPVLQPACQLDVLGEETGGIEATFETTGGKTGLRRERRVRRFAARLLRYDRDDRRTGPRATDRQPGRSRRAPQTPLGEIDPGAYAVRITQTRPGSSPLVDGRAARDRGGVPDARRQRTVLASLRAATGGTVVTTALDPWSTT
jgi:hypothetical protein